MVYHEDGSLQAEYLVSTAANGVGFEQGSFRTPTGQFEISQKIGNGEPLFTIFKGRKPVGIWDGSVCEHDLVLTRILWLHGLDDDNANTKERFIYIHGTNQEGKLGTPASCGCVRMGNEDMLELFELVRENERVEIG